MIFFSKILNKEIHIWAVFLIVAFGVFGFWMWEIHRLPIGYAYTLEIKVPNEGRTAFVYGERPALSNPDFYQKTRTELLKGNVDFIEVNLSSIILRVYKDHAMVKEVPILTKGKKGSWWETPAGLYKAETKIKSHRSSFSPVSTMWNIPFQGNFFIHGWPYYTADDTPVSSTYSGGCIRLSDTDAKDVYDMVALGMPILVFEESSIKDTYTYSPNIPPLSAKNYVAVDLQNNFVFLEHDTKEQKPLSLFTKLVTALVATEYLNIEKEIKITDAMVVETHTPRVLVGKSYSVFQLLFPLLMESSNESASALSSTIGQARLVSLMNDKARSIGMTSAQFVDATGIDKGNTGTVEDVFHLARYLYDYRKFILGLTNNVVDNGAYGSPHWNDLEGNLFKNDPGYVGGIAGFSLDNKQMALAVFDVNFHGVMRPIAFVALDSDDIPRDIRAMVEYVKNAYR